MRFAPVFLLATVAALLLAGCGGGDEGATATEATKPPAPPFLQVNLPGEAAPEAAGFLLAHRVGYFPQSRVHVWFVAPSHPARPPMYVEQELVDAAMIHEPQLILAREQGKPLVAFGSVVPHPTMAMIWLEGSGIHDIADLKGKTIAIPGIRFQKDFLEAVLARGGLTLADVNLKSVSYFLESELVHGRADAIFGGSMNTEGRRLQARGLDPVVTPVGKLGIPDYDELILVARRDRYAKDRELFQRLVRGTTRGNASVGELPGSATKAIGNAEKTKIPPAPTFAGVKEMAPHLSRTGRIDPERLQHLADWMYAQGMTERRWQASELLGG